MKKAYVKTQRKSLTLAVTPNVNTHTEAQEQQLDASIFTAFDFEGLTVQSTFKNTDEIEESEKTASATGIKITHHSIIMPSCDKFPSILSIFNLHDIKQMNSKRTDGF